MRHVSSFLLVILVSMLSASSSPQIRDWSSCEYDLDRVRRAARDASYAASDVESQANELEDCLNYPDIYDLMEDGCQGARWDYESSTSQLESELYTLNRRLRSVQDSCGYEFVLKTGVGGTTGGMCELLKRYKGQLTDAQLLAVCKSRMSEAECKKCLAGDK